MALFGNDSSLQIVIQARDEASRVLKNVQREVERTARKTSSSMEAMQQRFATAGQQMQSVGRRMALGISVPIAGAVGLALKSFSDFEKAIIEVQKVTSAEFAKVMSDSIKEMSETIPLARVELANITADAARFGIRGQENIERFTRAVAKMSVATDLTAQQAGESFAKLTTLTQTPVEEIEQLGSAINELSNNAATSSGEIVDSMLRSSAALTQLGLSNVETVALSGALNEVSESSERAGTRLRSFAQSLMDPGIAEKIAGAMGMTAEEFTNMRNNAPLETIKTLAERLDEGGPAADELRSALDNISNQVLASLGQNLEGINKAFNISNDAYEKGTSLQREFDAASKSLASTMQLLLNNLSNLGDKIAKALIPFIEKAARVFARLSQWFQNLPGPVQRFIAVALVLVAALGPLLIIVGALAAAIGALSVPILAVVGGMGALVAVGATVLTKWDAIKAKASELFGAFQPLANFVRRVFLGAWRALVMVWESQLKPAFEQLGAILAQHKEIFILLGKILGGVLLAALVAIATAISGVVVAAALLFSWFVRIASFVLNVMLAPFTLLRESIMQLAGSATTVGGQLQNIFSKTFGFIKGVVKDFANFGIDMVEGYVNAWIKGVNAIINALNKIQVSIPEWVPGIGGKSFGINLPNVSKIQLPRFEHGGIVPGPAGQPVPIMAHGGERVIPQSRTGATVYINQTNNFTVTNEMDARKASRMIDEGLRGLVRDHKLNIV